MQRNIYIYSLYKVVSCASLCVSSLCFPCSCAVYLCFATPSHHTLYFLFIPYIPYIHPSCSESKQRFKLMKPIFVLLEEVRDSLFNWGFNSYLNYKSWQSHLGWRSEPFELVLTLTTLVTDIHLAKPYFIPKLFEFLSLLLKFSFACQYSPEKFHSSFYGLKNFQLER